MPSPKVEYMTQGWGNFLSICQGKFDPDNKKKIIEEVSNFVDQTIAFSEDRCFSKALKSIDQRAQLVDDFCNELVRRKFEDTLPQLFASEDKNPRMKELVQAKNALTPTRDEEEYLLDELDTVVTHLQREQVKFLNPLLQKLVAKCDFPIDHFEYLSSAVKIVLGTSLKPPQPEAAEDPDIKSWFTCLFHKTSAPEIIQRQINATAAMPAEYKDLLTRLRAEISKNYFMPYFQPGGCFGSKEYLKQFIRLMNDQILEEKEVPLDLKNLKIKYEELFNAGGAYSIHFKRAILDGFNNYRIIHYPDVADLPEEKRDFFEKSRDNLLNYLINKFTDKKAFEAFLEQVKMGAAHNCQAHAEVLGLINQLTDQMKPMSNEARLLILEYFQEHLENILRPNTL